MAYSTIDKPSKYFTATTYTGNGSTLSISGINFSPDLVWIKDRTVGFDHVLQDSVRGTTKIINSNQTYAEFTNANSITSFNSDGFTTGSYVATNNNTTPFVSWSWRGSDSSAVSNTAGTISSTVSANTLSGFSIVSYTGTGANATVGHGLGVVPKFIIYKQRNTARNWYVFTSVIDGTYDNLYLNLTDAKTDRTITLPTSSVFSLSSSNEHNESSGTYIAYCFAEVKGFSKAFSYTGNGSTDGSYVHLGFRPAWVMVKASSTTGQWAICDNRRGTANTANGAFLFAESSEATNSAPANWDFLSNGLKARAGYAAHNSSGVTYIGLAFAENPFVSSKGIPACAV